jgi:hypothetical protein
MMEFEKIWKSLDELAAKLGWQLVERNVRKLRAKAFEILGGVQTFQHSTHSLQVLRLST